MMSSMRSACVGDKKHSNDGGEIGGEGIVANAPVQKSIAADKVNWPKEWGGAESVTDFVSSHIQGFQSNVLA
jgi:hypothetical protein